MIRIFLPLILLIIASTPVFTQTTFWRDISIDPGLGRTDSETTVADFRPISVDLATLRQLLRKAPEEHTTGRTSDLLEISLPLPGGSSERFFVYRSPVMMPQLAEKYPNIQSYRLIGVERANSSGRLAFGLDGISIVMQSRQGEVLIDAFDADNRDLYRVYYSHAMSLQGRAAAALSCGFAPESLPERLEPHEWEAERPLSGGRSGGQAVNLNVYTLALACTGEYARTHGGTVESVLSSYNEALTVLNEIYERELSIRFMLFNDIEKLIWLDPATDPFVDAAEGRGLIDQIAAAFTDNAKITLSSFDIGHLFTANCNDVGGVAAGFACEFGREKGVTCHA